MKALFLILGLIFSIHAGAAVSVNSIAALDDGGFAKYAGLYKLVECVQTRNEKVEAPTGTCDLANYQQLKIVGVPGHYQISFLTQDGHWVLTPGLYAYTAESAKSLEEAGFTSEANSATWWYKKSKLPGRVLTDKKSVTAAQEADNNNNNGNNNSPNVVLTFSGSRTERTPQSLSKRFVLLPISKL